MSTLDKEINNNDLISVIPGQIDVFEFLKSKSKVIVRREKESSNNDSNYINSNNCNYKLHKCK